MVRWVLSSLSCALVAAVISAGGAMASDGELREFETESQALIDATVAFFDAVENRTTPRQRIPVIGRPLLAKKASTPADPIDMTTLTRNGPVNHLTAYGITWYPVDRLLGSVDFMGTWNDNRDLVCGYLTWDLSDPANPRLDRLEARFVDLAALSHASDIEINQTLLDANCAYGAIDANFYLFDVAG